MQGGNQPADISRINRRDLLVSPSTPNTVESGNSKEEKIMIWF
jgi:hypothetical protein